jgi:hypothetical protein
MTQLSKNEKILLAIQNSFTDGISDWDDIVNSVNQAKIPVKNWLVVRGVLQWMINEKMVVRIKNVHEEKYTTNVEVTA